MHSHTCPYKSTIQTLKLLKRLVLQKRIDKTNGRNVHWRFTTEDAQRGPSKPDDHCRFALSRLLISLSCCSQKAQRLARQVSTAFDAPRAAAAPKRSSLRLRCRLFSNAASTCDALTIFGSRFAIDSPPQNATMTKRNIGCKGFINSR